MSNLRRLFPFTLALALCAFGQTSTPSAPTATAVLPSYIVGIGPTWMRGASNPYNIDVNLALRVGQTKWYSYTTISTPITTPIPGAQPVASSITTGGAFIPAQSASGAVSLVFIVQAGFSTVAANSTVAPSFSGSMAVAFRLGKSGWRSNVYVMPFAKAANATTATSSGALATAVFQPGVQMMYGFGGSKP